MYGASSTCGARLSRWWICVCGSGNGVLIGLIVDGVSEVLDIAEKNVVPPPDLRASQNKYIRGIGKLESSVVLLLDWEKLFSEDDQELLGGAAGETAEQAEDGSGAGEKQP